MKNFKTFIWRFTFIIIFIIANFNNELSSNINNTIINSDLVLLRENLELKIENKKIKLENKRMLKQLISYPTISPIKAKDFIRVSSPYGWRLHPTEKETLFHEGIDIAAKPGTPIYSTAHGVVIEVRKSKYGYGNRIIIEHEFGFKTLYAHLNKFYVRMGQEIKKNQKIGTVGNTGRSTGPHLHYEVIENNTKHNPATFFTIPIPISYNNLAMK